ncbi:MAG: HAD-IA family hydrolase [Gammaproteobacteria bacterium]|nr:HAD-IA family hydrolase [Gammaproteobacteria bacterium]MBT7308803.1 HAD-IA family hydrolase [Gammaproteobacteria bacterium]
MGYKAVLFDLDGTLADTAPDLAYALNQTLIRANREPLALASIRAVASNGSAPLIRLGFGEGLDESEFSDHQQRLLSIYRQNLTRETTLMRGMAPLLNQLEEQSIRWGVVTNKPARFTEPLMEQLALTQRAACIVSGDTTTEPKPHPRPLLYACEQLGLEPSLCLYVGDARRDIEAGRRARMTTLAARFGYLTPEDEISHWGADGIIDQPGDILQWIH